MHSAVFIGLLLASDTTGTESPIGAVDYTTQIKPILTERCLACHGALKQ